MMMSIVSSCSFDRGAREKRVHHAAVAASLLYENGMSIYYDGCVKMNHLQFTLDSKIIPYNKPSQTVTATSKCAIVSQSKHMSLQNNGISDCSV